MDRDHLRAFALRDWKAIARSKRDYQASLFREQGSAATVRAAREREADLAHHVELKRALSRVRR